MVIRAEKRARMVVTCSHTARAFAKANSVFEARGRLLQEFFGFGESDHVTPLILGVSIVPFDPVRRDCMGLSQLSKWFPQILIFHRFFSSVFPVFRDPSVHPLCQSIGDILAVSMNCDRRSKVDGFKCTKDCGDFHALVGGVDFPPASNDLFISTSQNICPSARSGITKASTIREEIILGTLWHALHSNGSTPFGIITMYGSASNRSSSNDRCYRSAR